MIRILVVDDEKYIADFTSALLSDLEGEEIEIQTAYLGKTALAFSAEKKIDVLVTDIEMPGMDGFELAEAVCARWRDCKVILLTAYDSFRYSQRAIRANVSDYVLKLESNDRILSAVHAAVASVLVARDRERQMQEERFRAERADSRFKQKLYFDYLLGMRADDPLRSEIGFESCLFLAVNVRRIGSFSSAEFLESVMDTDDFLRAAFEAYAEVISTVSSGSRILLLLLPRPDCPDMTVVAEYVKEDLDGLAAEAKRRYSVSLAVAFIKNPLRFSQLGQSVRYACDLVSDRYVIENELILQADLARKDLFFRTVQREELLPDSEIFLLGVYLGNEQFGEFETLAETMLARLLGATTEQIVRADFLFVRLFVVYVTEKGLLARFKPQLFKNCFDFILRCETAAELSAEVRSLLDLIRFRNAKEDESDYNRQLLENVNRYIAENLDKDLSLTTIADKFCFNPSYFSRMYKRLAKVSLSEVIWGVKLESAKKMLLGEDFSVKSIAERLGFESNAYFTKFFKKMTGKTPIEFRKNQLVNWREK